MNPQAIAFVARERAELMPVDAPPPPGPAEIVGRTLCTLVSPGTELAWGYTGKSFPSYPGYAAVCEVTQTGADVKKHRVGDLVFCMGGHRSFQRLHENDAVPVPAGLAPEIAVLARLMGVSMTTLITTAARPGDLVLVTGAGPVGFLAAQVFRAAGFRVAVVEPHAQRRAAVATAGVAHVFDAMPFGNPDFEGVVALVVECSGHEQAALDACRMVRKRGEVVLVGVPWQRATEIYAHDLLHAIFHKYAVLRSGWEWELPRHGTDFMPHSIFANYATALAWLHDGVINTAGLSRSVSPCDAQQVYQDLLHRRAPGGELFVVFDWRLLPAN